MAALLQVPLLPCAYLTVLPLEIAFTLDQRVDSFPSSDRYGQPTINARIRSVVDPFLQII
jgi:hypothetical protein